MVDSSQTQMAYVAESTYGTTPLTPGFQIARFTSEDLNANIQNDVSNEIRADRNVTDLVQVGQNAGGPINFELSYGSFEDWLESLMYSTWASNVLKNGVTQKSFTLEKKFEAGVTDQYHRFPGAIANSMSLAIQAGKIVTGSFDFLAQNMTDAQAIISGATYTAANTNPVMNAAANFASLAVTGASGIEITALDLNVTNNLRQQPIVGSLSSRGIGTGRFVVTGTLTAYFVDQSLIDLFLAGTAADLSFTIGGASNNNYDFAVGNLKFDTAKIVAGGNDQDVMAAMTFHGLFDGTDNTFSITRNPAP